jgi:hypothetical protein
MQCTVGASNGRTGEHRSLASWWRFKLGPFWIQKGRIHHYTASFGHMWSTIIYTAVGGLILYHLALFSLIGLSLLWLFIYPSQTVDSVGICDIWCSDGGDSEEYFFLSVMPCGLVEVYRRSGGTCCLRLQSWSVSRANKQANSYWERH